MPVTGLNHINIRTQDIGASARFYVEVFDFVHREGPVVMGNQANWLFDQGDNPIIHLRLREADSTSTGPIDHIALDCEDRPKILARLDARNVKYTVTENLIPGVVQVFLVDPHGVPLELSFRDDPREPVKG